LGFEMSDDPVVEELEGGTILLGTRGGRGPDSLAPVPAGLTARPLGDLAVHHHEADPLLRRVVGGLDAGGIQEPKVMVRMLTELRGDLLDFAALRRRTRHVKHVPVGLAPPPLGGCLVAPVPPGSEEVLGPRQRRGDVPFHFRPAPGQPSTVSTLLRYSIFIIPIQPDLRDRVSLQVVVTPQHATNSRHFPQACR